MQSSYDEATIKASKRVADGFAFLGEPEVFGITTRADAPSP
jgi:hypothetical protein